ncbi:hypothetical protein VTK26DRAFT_775 [Humicola hyalothermophila]
MPGLFSRLKGRDNKTKKNRELEDQQPQKPRWEDAWARTNVEPDEVQELIRFCTEELKARALDIPFLLLPFRPTSDPSAVRTFVRHFFGGKDGGGQTLRGEALAQELRMTEPMVISGVIKWCWSRLHGGVVGWDSYELFKVGEQDSNMARDSFKTFIPLSVDNEARSKIIFDFFDLLSAVAAHSKMNGFGGRKLSRMAGWWAFEHNDAGNGYEGGYKTWLRAADATSHLFFAYLRSLAPEPTVGGISLLPMSLQKLLQETEYPPQRPALMQTSTYRVAMIVENVSPTPFALLRRANHFQYRDEDKALKEWSEYEDPIKALTEECRRVLRAISAANQSQAVSSSKHSTSLRDASWSRFEDIGFSSALEDDELDDDSPLAMTRQQQQQQQQQLGLRNTPASGNGDLGRPTTPSWADFLSSGFVDDRGTPSHLLPPDKVLPPIDTGVRQRSSQSHRPRLEHDHQLEPGELASIVRFDLDDAFWWVWMSSLAPEETPERKSAFGRCAVIETVIRTGRWLVMEEIVKGAAPDPEDGAYIAEKKSFFSWTRRGKTLSRRKSTGKHALEKGDAHLKPSATMGFSKTSIGPDQQAKIQAAALQLQRQEQQKAQEQTQERRGRKDTDWLAERTNSVLTLQSSILSEASPAVKWANKYDKEAIREAYLADANAGRGTTSTTARTNGHAATTANEEDRRPELPPKAPSSSAQPTPATAPSSTSVPPHDETQTPTPRVPQGEEKVSEASKNLQATQQVPTTGRDSPLPPPPKEAENPELMREQMVSPEPDMSPEGIKQKKLHKETAKTGGGNGLRKLFSRRNRHSKLPENAAEQLSSFTAAQEPAPAPAAPQQVAQQEEPQPAAPKEEQVPPQAAPAPAPVPPSPVSPVAASRPVGAPQAEPEPVSPPTPPAREEEDISPVSMKETTAAKDEFSRFDQGPLLDQPAFVPEDDTDDADDAVPPPIARHPPQSPRSPVSSPAAPQQEKKEAAAPPPAPVARTIASQDRWAQMRKNAAERAAQLNQPAPKAPAFRRNIDGDSTSSGEETIESRVARIKARVAELTANAEGISGPGPRGPPPPIRR